MNNNNIQTVQPSQDNQIQSNNVAQQANNTEDSSNIIGNTI